MPVLGVAPEPLLCSECLSVQPRLLSPALKLFCLTLAILFLVESTCPYCLPDFPKNLALTQPANSARSSFRLWDSGGLDSQNSLYFGGEVDRK